MNKDHSNWDDDRFEDQRSYDDTDMSETGAKGGRTVSRDQSRHATSDEAYEDTNEYEDTDDLTDI